MNNPFDWSSITVPTLILDETKARRNLARMVARTQAAGVRLRPHFKTHQSAAMGEWFREVGVTGIATSSLRMAAYFADAGWDDITVAFPVNWREIDTINGLAKRIRLGLIVEAVETAQFLAEHLSAPVDVWLDIDAGYGRTGMAWDATADLLALATAVTASPLLRLLGLLTHAGHSYGARTRDEVTAVYRETTGRLAQARDGLEAAGYTGLQLSPGDTPSCSLVDDLAPATEVRPGNFIYYDWTQVLIGSCTAEDVAVALACPVVAKQAARRQIVVYGGGVHLSKDVIVDGQGRKSFGAVAFQGESGWGAPLDETYVASLSQEHGVILADAETFERVQIGDLLMIYPVHSCMTADLMKRLVSLDGREWTMLELNELGV